MSPALRLIVFDLDGTLIDSRRDITDAANALLVSYGVEPLSEERIGAMVGDGAATLVARAFKTSGLTPAPDVLQRYLALYDGCLLNHTRLYDGMAEVIETLASRTAVAVLTNKPIAPTRRILEALGVARHFSAEAVLGGDGPFPRKPDPSALLHLVARAGATPASTLMVGDSAIDWRTACAARTQVCLARYGFGFHSVPLHELAPGVHLISAPTELLAL